MPASPGSAFPYHRIVDDLRLAIVAGRLAPGERLSSEWELAQQYQTSRPTVRRAVAVLKAEGLVVTEQGPGDFCPPEASRATGGHGCELSQASECGEMAGGRALRVGACLSLTGRYSRFGVSAAHGLEAWRLLDGNAELVIHDDKSDPACLKSCLPALAARCDLLLGPYSTQLMRTASRLAWDLDCLVWNHGGSGDDVERQLLVTSCRS